MAKTIPEGISAGLAGLLTELQARLDALERVRPNLSVGGYRIAEGTKGELIVQHTASGTTVVLMQNPT